MKTNTYVVNDKEDVKDSGGLREVSGNRAIGFVEDPEEELIRDIDEDRMHPAKIIATRFLDFLKDRRLSMSTLKLLPRDEQQRLKKEFLESN